MLMMCVSYVNDPAPTRSYTDCTTRSLHDALPIGPFRVRHEQCAVHMAEGYAHVTGRPGGAMVTSGPAATNIVTPLTDAYMDSIPMIVITGQVATGAIG